LKIDRKKSTPKGRKFEPAGIRTQDPYIKSVMLYQLSYRPVTNSKKMVAQAGIEPATRGFSGRCSTD
jgi:hypothetical protein